MKFTTSLRVLRAMNASFLFLFGVASMAWAPTIQQTSTHVALNFDELVPSSTFSVVRKQLVRAWECLVLLKQGVAHDEREAVLNAFIDQLIAAHYRVDGLTADISDITPDDIEYLLGFIQALNEELVAVKNGSVDQVLNTASYLLCRLTDKLNQLEAEELEH